MWVNDELLDDLVFEFEAPSERIGYIRAVRHIDNSTLHPDKPWLFKIDVEWRMPVCPQWVLGAQLADNCLVAKIEIQRNFMTEATLTWGAWPDDVMPRTPEFRSFGWAHVTSPDETEPRK